jgi:hypothetical protein
MFPIDIQQYEGSYRVGKTFAIGDGAFRNISGATFDHKGVLIRNQDSNTRNITITFPGNDLTCVFAIPDSTSSLQRPYIIPCRVNQISIALLEAGGPNGIRVTLLH